MVPIRLCSDAILVTAPAIRHALEQSDAVTAVSAFLAEETHRLLPTTRPPEIIHNFFVPPCPTRTREQVRTELGLRPEELLVLHASNLRSLKRIDLLLAAFARLPAELPCRLLVLAGGDWRAHAACAEALGIADRILVLTGINDLENYLQAADLTFYTSETESFCLGILEGMFFGCPCVSTAVGGIPEVLVHGETGMLVPFEDADGLATALRELLLNPMLRAAMSAKARARAESLFSARIIVPRYEDLYRRVMSASASTAMLR